MCFELDGALPHLGLEVIGVLSQGLSHVIERPSQDTDLTHCIFTGSFAHLAVGDGCGGFGQITYGRDELSYHNYSSSDADQYDDH